jgi:hypothetical protein
MAPLARHFSIVLAPLAAAVLLLGCPSSDGTPADAGAGDAEATDAPLPDGTVADTALPDAGDAGDAGSEDAAFDADGTDSAPPDASLDASQDAGPLDAGPSDAGPPRRISLAGCAPATLPGCGGGVRMLLPRSCADYDADACVGGPDPGGPNGAAPLKAAASVAAISVDVYPGIVLRAEAERFYPIGESGAGDLPLDPALPNTTVLPVGWRPGSGLVTCTRTATRATCVCGSCGAGSRVFAGYVYSEPASLRTYLRTSGHAVTCPANANYTQSGTVCTTP